MGKKQKMKKAAQMAANGQVPAELQKQIDEKERATAAAACALACASKEKLDGIPLDPAYRNNLKKLMNLAQKLPSNLLSAKKMEKQPSSDSGTGDSGEEDDLSDSDDDIPDLVDAETKRQLGLGLNMPGEAPKQSRGEKKARRLLMKLDLKPMENVARVTMRKNKNILLYIDRPDVYKVPHGDTIICFGEVRVEDISTAAAAQAAERYRMPATGEAEDSKDGLKDTAAVAHPDDDDDEEVDEEAAKVLDEKDIELVEMQAVCTRKQAIKALLKNENDVVNAIMALTVG
ncbi:hypothetical protein KR067_010626 [Drosophila pandora]|nr:hypothetical protein KR067_010626 [Drosophila pandora]